MDLKAGQRAPGSRLSPDELRKLSETQTVRAIRIERGPERLRVLAVANVLMDMADIKELLLKYEHRLLN
jgi:hypothetical protein